MSRLSLDEQKQLDILAQSIKINNELLENGVKDMSPTIKSYIIDLNRAFLLLYEKSEGIR